MRRFLSIAAIAFTALAPAAAAQAPPDKLGDPDRERIARAEAAGDPTVTLLVAARPDRLAQARADLEALGGDVLARDRVVDYLKVEVPTDRAAKAGRLKSVVAVDVDGLVQREEPEPLAAQNPVPQPPPTASTPRVNPYMPTTDTKAAEWVNSRPEWDGRHTVIAVLDTGIDLEHPALQTTTTGRHKIVDWYNANAVNSGDGSWVPVTGSHTGTFAAGGATYTAPATGGPYAFGRFHETAGDLGSGSSETGGDVNRDGDRTDAFGVLQDTVTKQVRVDLDQDADFTDEPPMIDFKVDRDVRFFGTDDPATAVVDRIPFVVVTDRPGHVNLGFAGGQHGTHVAGITAANGMFSGRMSGAAPGAQLMAVKVCLTTPSCTSSGLIDGVLYAARNGADVANISIGGLPALNYNGANARSALYNRTIAEFGMQIFNSAGNSGPGANVVGDPAVATNSVAVAASITKNTWRSNYGSIVSTAFSLMPFSSRGPAEDGAFKPQLTAPGSAVSTTPLWQGGGSVAGTYALPPGYSMLNGTSMAAPQATGAAALLVSAYKSTFGGAVPANGPRPDPMALRSAMIDSAAFKPGIGAYAQGAGLVQTNAAWRKLADKPSLRRIEATVPVDTSLEQFLTTPGIGTGIHDREGVRVGRTYTRTYTLRRTTGPAGPETYTVLWKGDGSVFRSARTVVLPLDQDVSFPVTIRPSKTGVHSAILRLDSRATPGVDLTTLNTVFAPVEFTAAGGYQHSVSGKLARNAPRSFLFRVPEGASAFRVDLAGGGPASGAGQIRFLRYHPNGTNVDPTSSTSCYTPDAGGGCTGGTPNSRTVVGPSPGVWEVTVEARRTSDTNAAPFTLTASILGAAVSPDPDVISSAQAGTPVERTYTVTNTAGAFTGRLVGGPLDSARYERPTVAQGALESYDVVVPAGATSMSARIGDPADVSADLDLYVYDCTSGSCVLDGISADGDSEESVTATNPAPGLWRVTVEGYAVPAGTTAYDYEDRVAAPAFGSVDVTDVDALRALSASWTVPGTVVANTAPAAGRVLAGALRVVTDGGVTLSRSRVIVQAVE